MPGTAGLSKLRAVVNKIAATLSILALLFAGFEYRQARHWKHETDEALWAFHRINAQLNDRTNNTYKTAYAQNEVLRVQIDALRSEVKWLEAKNLELISLIQAILKAQEEDKLMSKIPSFGFGQ